MQLIDQVKIGTASTSGYPRAPLRFEFRPMGYDSNSDFYLYSSHFKAGDTATDQMRRLAESQTIRFDSDALPAGTPILYTGDFNIQSSSEGMYTTLLAPGNGQAFDPINAPGTWHNNAGFAAIHTQAPLVAPPGSLTGGGMDDRFDFQLVTGTVTDGEGMSYIGTGVPNTSVAPSQHSYHAFGNNGTTYNSDINNASNTALPISEYNPDIGAGEPSRATVLNSLATASDHLPVVADYQLPARMGAAVDAAPARVIKDTPLSVDLHVSNTAPLPWRSAPTSWTIATVPGAGQRRRQYGAALGRRQLARLVAGYRHAWSSSGHRQRHGHEPTSFKRFVQRRGRLYGARPCGWRICRSVRATNARRRLWHRVFLRARSLQESFAWPI